MPTNGGRETLGEALDRCYAEAIGDWLRYNARKASHEVALTSYVREIEINARMRPARANFVVVNIDAVRRGDDGAYAFDLQMTPFTAWKRRPRA